MSALPGSPELTGVHLRELVHPDDSAALEALWHRVDELILGAEYYRTSNSGDYSFAGTAAADTSGLSDDDDGPTLLPSCTATIGPLMSELLNEDATNTRKNYSLGHDRQARFVMRLGRANAASFVDPKAAVLSPSWRWYDVVPSLSAVPWETPTLNGSHESAPVLCCLSCVCSFPRAPRNIWPLHCCFRTPPIPPLPRRVPVVFLSLRDITYLMRERHALHLHRELSMTLASSSSVRALERLLATTVERCPELACGVLFRATRSGGVDMIASAGLSPDRIAKMLHLPTTSLVSSFGGGHSLRCGIL